MINVGVIKKIKNLDYIFF